MNKDQFLLSNASLMRKYIRYIQELNLKKLQQRNQEYITNLMSTKSDSLKEKLIENFSDFSKLSDYSFMNYLRADPQSTKDGNDHKPRSIYSGHYVPVVPTAIPEPELSLIHI